MALVTILSALCIPTSRAIAQEDYPLVAAAADGGLADVRALLDGGADPNEADESLATPLMAASFGGHVQVVLLLLERGADMSLRDVDGDDALSFAVYGESAEVARTLLDRGADPNAPNAMGQTPFLLAARHHDADLVRLLFERGADLTRHDVDGDAALHYAAMGGSADIAILLVDHGADPNQANLSGVTPLCQAAAFDNVAVVRALLDRGAEVNRVDADGSTALHHAALAGAVDAMMVLIDRGADVNATSRGWTPWMVAVSQFDTTTADALAARGADNEEELRRAVERATEAAGWAQGMRIDMALAALADAWQLVPDLPIRGEILNVVCWNGTLVGEAERVAEICDQAVAALPSPGVRDSRGLNRAVRDELSGALADFESFVAGDGVQGKELREQWIADLERGTNPITSATLEQLRYPWLGGSAIASTRHLGFDLIAMIPGLSEVPDSALISQEGPYETNAFQRVFSAGGKAFGWGDARLSGVVFNATLMGGARLASAGVSDISGLSEAGFRETFLASLGESMGFDAATADVEALVLDALAPPHAAWRVGAELEGIAATPGETTAIDVHLVFFARQRIIATCVIVGFGRVPVDGVVRIVQVFESRVQDALPKS